MTTHVRPARRRPIRVLVIVVALVFLAAGCGDDDDGDTAGGDTAPATSAVTGTPSGGMATTSSSEPDDVDPEGVLRIAADLTSAGGVKLDPKDMNQPTDFWIHAMIYGTLLRQLEDGSYAPALAEEAVVTNPTTLDIRLREGVMFQDGTPFNAEAVKFSIERNAATNKTQTFRMAELSQIDAITVKSDTELTITFKTPIAGSFVNLLAHGETTVVSPTAAQAPGADLNADPVGAGPFKFVSFTPEQSLVLERWDGYYDADRIRLAGVEIVQALGAPAVTNGLQGGQIDAATASHDLVKELQGIDGIATMDRKSPDAVNWVSLRCDTNETLRDIRVRQALNFATDKEALNEILFDGLGEPMSQFWTSDTPYFNPDIADAFPHDPERAKALLAEAGVPDLRLTIAVPAVTSFGSRAAELLQAQWAEAGIELELVPTQNIIQDYYLDKKMDSFVTTQGRFWTDKLTRNFVPGSTGNTCDPQSEEFNQMLLELRGLDPASDEAAEKWHEISAFLTEGAYGVWGVMGTQATAWREDRLGNPAWTPNQLGALFPDVHEVYIRRN